MSHKSFARLPDVYNESHFFLAFGNVAGGGGGDMRSKNKASTHESMDTVKAHHF